MLKRDIDNKMIGGVCAGIANHMDIDTSIVRLIFLAGLLFGSLSFWIYLILWLVMPKDSDEL
jgi:phage shock protein PspC (stress-responsive transcriptional regulator)